MAKQVAWEGDVRAAGLRQRTPIEVLSRVLARPLLEEKSWTRWCATGSGAVHVPKAAIYEGFVCDMLSKFVCGNFGKEQAKPRRKKLLKRMVLTRKRRVHLIGKGSACE